MGEWRKAIPEGRDRVQSRVLVWSLGPVLIFYAFQSLTRGMQIGGCRNAGFAIIGLSVSMAMLVWLRKSATGPAAAMGGIICYLLTVMTASCKAFAVQSAFAPLLAMLVLTLGATNIHNAKKLKLGVQESHEHRTAAQVIANLGLAPLCFPLLLGFVERYSGTGRYMSDFVIIPAMMIAALCEAAADTVSSEIGQAYGGRPFLITKMSLVEPGTDGAVSLIGTFAGLLGAAIVAYVSRWGLLAVFEEPIADIGTSMTHVAFVSFSGGAAGLLFDSILGATVERKGWLGNDLVNFSSTVFAAGVALGVLLVWR